jgi:glucose-1-phosphate cytidylyltransferase
VTLIDTGDSTETGGRLGRVRSYLGDEPFCFTYGDGVADVDMTALIAHHREQGLQATLTAVQPPGRYGALHLDGDRVGNFQEKADGEQSWINGGFLVLEPSVCDLIHSDTCLFEADVLSELARRGQLAAYRHQGFWQSMDTLRERTRLEALWESGQAPWKLWS